MSEHMLVVLTAHSSPWSMELFIATQAMNTFLKHPSSAERWMGTSASLASEAGHLQEAAEACRGGNFPVVTQLGKDSSPECLPLQQECCRSGFDGGRFLPCSSLFLTIQSTFKHEEQL